MQRRTLKLSVALALGASVTVVGPVLAQTSPANVTTVADTVDADPGDGQCADASGACSLRAAIQEANAGGADTIRLAGRATYALQLTGPGEDAAATGDLDITSAITIEGRGATVDAGDLGDRAFDVLAGASLTVDDVTVTGGQPPSGSSGGAFQSAGSLRISSSRLSGNVADGPLSSGGAVFNAGGELVVQRSVLQDNRATRAGGAIEANAGSTELSKVRLVDNETGPTPGNGGAFHLTGAGTVSVEDAVVTGNTAAAEGGGLWNSAAGTMTVTDSHFSGNVASGAAADQGGGALFNDGGELTVDGRTVITDNHADGASGSGGGILNDGGVLTVSASTVSDNSARRAGGGIEADAGTTTLVRVDLRGNETGPMPGNGGGLHLTGAGTVDISRSRVTANTAAAEGGGLWNSATGTMTATDTVVQGNQAPVGPEVFNDGGTFTLNGQPVAPTP